MILVQYGTFALGTLIPIFADRLTAPIVLWGVPEPTLDGPKLRSNSFCGINMNAHTLMRLGRKYDYIFCGPDEAPAALAPLVPRDPLPPAAPPRAFGPGRLSRARLLHLDLRRDGPAAAVGRRSPSRHHGRAVRRGPGHRAGTPASGGRRRFGPRPAGCDVTDDGAGQGGRADAGLPRHRRAEPPDAGSP